MDVNGAELADKTSEKCHKGAAQQASWHIYRHWIDLLAYLGRRLYYRDQSPQTLASLENLARTFDPTVIVELGTLGGMSLRAWIRSAPKARIVAVDLSFDTLRQSAEILPLDLSRVILLETDILKVDFSSLWNADDRVLFFVDAHDLPGVPIMRHVCEQVVPALPPGSLVVVDDLWHSPQELSRGNAAAFLEGKVLPEIDELQCFEGYYAPYHGGGSFMGFREVRPLLHYVNARGIHLHFDGNAKNVSFQIPPPAVRTNFDAEDFSNRCGVVVHNPLLPEAEDNSRSGQAMRRIAAIYRKAGPTPALNLLLDVANKEAGFPGLAYALAVCQARLGQPDATMELLRCELAGPAPHPHAAKLLADLVTTFQTHRVDGQARRCGLTLFAMPKAFAGHVGDIQRNAIESWTRLSPRPEIILFGDEPGIAAIAAELGLRHEPVVGRNDCGTPLVDALFGAAQNLATTDIVAYVNADIVLFDDFPAAVDNVRGQVPEFLMMGQRMDYDLIGRIDFTPPDWAANLWQDVQENGQLHAETGIDYFVFTPGLWHKIPPLALGRTVWDSWLLKNVHDLGKAVIDATGAIRAIHQSHGYRANKAGDRIALWSGIEARRNQLLAGPIDGRAYTSGATLALGADGSLTRRQPTPAMFQLPGYPQKRLKWLLRQATRLLAANQSAMAIVKLEEAVMLVPDNPEVQALFELISRKQDLPPAGTKG